MLTGLSSTFQPKPARPRHGENRMEPIAAFNATGIQGDIVRDGFRLYVEREGIYFIRVGNLDRLARPGQGGDHTGMPDRNLLLAFFVSPFFLFLRGSPSRTAGRDLLRTMEEQPLTERLKADPANFLLRTEDIVSSAIRSGGGSFWRRGHGTWGFQLQDGRLAVLAFHSAMDRFIAEKHLPSLLGGKLIVKAKARRPD
jgi:hypothetical protein